MLMEPLYPKKATEMYPKNASGTAALGSVEQASVT